MSKGLLVIVSIFLALFVDAVIFVFFLPNFTLNDMNAILPGLIAIAATTFVIYKVLGKFIHRKQL